MGKVVFEVVLLLSVVNVLARMILIWYISGNQIKYFNCHYYNGVKQGLLSKNFRLLQQQIFTNVSWFYIPAFFSYRHGLPLALGVRRPAAECRTESSVWDPG